MKRKERAWQIECEEQRIEAPNRARKQKTLAFRRIIGFRIFCRFIEVEETSPPLCNLLSSLKTHFLLVKDATL